MELLDLLFRAGLIAGATASVALAFLIPLYVQQSRDVRRLRDWAALTPDRGTAEFQAAESLGRPAPVQAAATATAPARGDTAPMPAVSAAQRVARELPAAARATTERPAVLIREPWWRRFIRRPEPKYLVAIVAGVVTLGIGVGVLAVQLREGNAPATPTSTGAGAVVPADVNVAVLNGTDVPGLAAKVGDDLQSGGFMIGAITNSPSVSRSLVMYQRGHEREAQAVAHQLGIDRVEVIQADIEQIVQQASDAVGLAPAPVVVIAGADRASL